MGNKVYLFMYGSDDNRTVGGVFSTRAAAEAAVRFGDETSQVIERELDAPNPPAPEGRSLWNMYYSMMFPEYTGHRVPAYGTHADINHVTFDGEDYSVLVWAVDEQDALRQAEERIQRFRQKQLV